MIAEDLLREMTDARANDHTDHERVYTAISGNRTRRATREVTINGDRFLVEVTAISFRHEQPDTDTQSGT